MGWDINFHKKCYNTNMKIKSLVILALLFIMSTSLFSEHVFTLYEADSCTSTEHHHELEDSAHHNEMHDEIHCEIHCEYHHSYVLPQQNILTSLNTSSYLPINKKDSYIFNTNLEFFKPPIV